LLDIVERAIERVELARRKAGRPARRLSLKKPASGRLQQATPAGAAELLCSAESWFLQALAAALPMLVGSLPRDERGLCVVPHPHKLVKRHMPFNRRYMTGDGALAYDTHRSCDNCDKLIVDRCWFSCKEGCDVDFCSRCHTKLQQAFAGQDVELAAWVTQFVGRVAYFLLRCCQAIERRAIVQELAFHWPLQLFDVLVGAISEVADAKVVHVEDGKSSNISANSEFWHIIGMLRLIQAANELPARELRFGELSPRGPRVPSSRFLLGAIDKCDAEAEWVRWNRWRSQPEADQAQPPEEAVLYAEQFEVSEGFALFLAHGSLVPIGFRQRCLRVDAYEAAFGVAETTPMMHLRVLRDPHAIFEAAVTAFGREEQHLAFMASVTFISEPGVGPGVIREFLGLAFKSLLRGSCSAAAGSSLEGEAGSHASSAAEGHSCPWEYDPQLRTHWLSDATTCARPEVYRACGALLGHAILTETFLPAAFPAVLYGLLLRAIGSTRVAAPTLADLASAQPDLARGLTELIHYEGADVAEVFPLSWPRSAELNTENRKQYAEAYVKWFFEERYAAQLGPLYEGFRAVLGGSELLRVLVDASQLEQIVCGVEVPLDVAAIRQNAEMRGWSREDESYLELFWEVLGSLSDLERIRFIVFLSACGRTPPEGWKDFELRVQKNGRGDARLPTAYTCFNLLLLPRYSSAEILRSRLCAAIQETEGFGLS
jgi:hypothetical protein